MVIAKITASALQSDIAKTELGLKFWIGKLAIIAQGAHSGFK